MSVKLMQRLKSKAARVGVAFSMLLTMFAIGCAHAGLFGDAIKLEVHIQDERGEAIPHVSLWRCEEPHKVLFYRECFKDTLWRMTEHYRRSFEFATPFHTPINMLSVPSVSDDKGIVVEPLMPEDIFGRNGKYPERISLYYTFMKYGYLPAKVDFEQLEWGTHKKVTVTLQRDPKITDADKPYFKEYDHIRYLVSDTARNETRTIDNNTRLEGLREQVEKLAQDALRDGNKPAAARMYARIQVLPVIEFIKDKPVGFRQADPASPRNREALAKAYELDPGHPYIRAMYFEYRIRHALTSYFGDKVNTPIDLKQNTELAEARDELAKLIQERGEEVWPTAYHGLGALYASAGDYENGYRTMLQLCRTEPAYMDCKALVGIVTGKAKLRGVPYPKEWDTISATTETPQ